MAKVHLAQLPGPHGFSRLVAMKCLHEQYAKEPDFVAMLFDEARLLSRVRHPNVVPVLEVIEGESLALVMEYVEGTTLARLASAVRAAGSEAVPLAVVSAIACDMLEGLHAAHEALGDGGEPLGIVHRDVSPQNVMLDRDGVAKILDFGVAKAEGRITSSAHGSLKGKAGYMAPEQVRGGDVDRRCDVFAAGIVLWELVVGDRFASAENPVAQMLRILEEAPRVPSTLRADVPPALDAVILRALARSVDARFATTRDMALALEAAVRPASRREVAAWVASVGREDLAKSAEQKERALSQATVLADTVPLTTIHTATLSPVKPKRVGWIVGGAGFLAVVAVGIGVMQMRAEPKTPEAPRIASPPEGAAPPATSETPAARASASAPIDVAPAASTAKPHVGRTPPLVRTKRAPPRCDPPYTIREDGIHVPKPECL